MTTTFKRALAAVVASATVAAAVPAVANGQEETYKAFGVYSGYTHHDEINGDKSINFLRAVPSSTADSATTAPVAESELVYCFNENWEFPKDWEDFGTAKANAEYTKLSNVTADKFDNLANQDYELSRSRNQASRLHGEELKAKVLNIVYNGYDNTKSDRAGLQAALGLSDGEFYWATQRAIWYFTENTSFSVSGAKSQLSPEGFKAFQILIGSPDAPEVPGVELKDVASRTDSASLNLFENTNKTNADGKTGITGSFTPYQHLLSAQFVDESGNPIVETPTPSTSEQPTTEKVTTTTSAATETEVVTTTPKTTVTETAPSTVETVTETTGVTTTTVTVPGEPVTTTETEPGKVVTETETEPNSTTTEKVPGTVVTETESEPNSTTTEKVPGTVVTETETEPNSTTTEKVPGTVVTETETEPDSTTTETEPGTVVTETTKADDVTTTETQPAATVTETAPQETVTETTTPAEATVTTTVPIVTEVENAPYIGTKATDKADQDKSFTPEGGVLVDTIEYLGLKPGTEYTVSGELMEKDKDGNAIPTGIKAGATFTPETADGSIDVEFTIPEGFEGKTLVVFEELELAGKVVAEHKNIDSVNQTVVVGEKTPLIGTIAHEKGSDKTDKIVESGKVIDEVEYTNFIPGEEYTIKGELMDYATHKGTGIVAEKTFVAEEANGTVELEFTIPADFGTKVLVAFETAYDANGEKVAEHVDITDNAQTIATGDEPIDGPKPSNPGDNGSSHSGWLWGLIPAAGILGFIGGSSHGSSNGSSHDGVVESPKHEAPKGESAQEAPKSEQPQEAPAKGKRANLANTGADVWMIGLAALLLVVAGGALVLRNRRES